MIQSCSLAYFVVALRKRDFMMRKGGDCSSISTTTQPHSPSYFLPLSLLQPSFFITHTFLISQMLQNLSYYSVTISPSMLGSLSFPFNPHVLLSSLISCLPISLFAPFLCLSFFLVVSAHSPLSLSHPSPTALCCLVCTRSGDAGGGKMERMVKGKD